MAEKLHDLQGEICIHLQRKNEKGDVHIRRWQFLGEGGMCQNLLDVAVKEVHESANFGLLAWSVGS